MTTELETPKSYSRHREGFMVAGPDGRYYESAAVVAEMEAEIIQAQADAEGNVGIGQQSQDELDGSPSRVEATDDDGAGEGTPADDPSQSAEVLPDAHYRDLTVWQREVLDARYPDLDEDQQRKYDLDKTEFDMETPVNDTEPPDPTAPIGRPQAGRSSTTENPQAAFGDIIINVEDTEGIALLNALAIRAKNKEAASKFNKADDVIKKDLTRRGYYDAKPHNIRVQGHLLVLAPADGETQHMDFDRKPSTRLTIKAADSD